MTGHGSFAYRICSMTVIKLYNQHVKDLMDISREPIFSELGRAARKHCDGCLPWMKISKSIRERWGPKM